MKSISLVYNGIKPSYVMRFVGVYEQLLNIRIKRDTEKQGTNTFLTFHLCYVISGRQLYVNFM